MAQDIVLLFFNSFAGKYLLLDWFVTAIVPYFFLALILLIVWRRSLRQMLVALLAMCGAIFADLVADSLLNVARPFVVLPVTIIAQHAPTNSFPSGHTLVAFTLAFSVVFCAPKRGKQILALILATIIGLSRLYLGVHWTVDLAASIVIAGIIVYFVRGVVDRTAVAHTLKKVLPVSLQSVLREK